MTISQYLDSVNKRYKSGISKEHSYRGDMESLIRELVKDIEITNEPSNVTDCGNPDYVITNKKGIPVGFIEAKDIDKDLNSKNYKEQFDRYKKALDNLIITNYVWFKFYQNGELVHEISIAEIQGNAIVPKPENFTEFENLLHNFCTFIGQTIKSPKKLAEMMAAKARLLENTLERALNSDEETNANTSLKDQYESFKQILIHELSIKEFADIYAQTLAYGMFAARLHDDSLDTFSRYEAAELIPKTNPFLRKLFGYIAGPDVDERIRITLDNLADVFRATDIKSLLKNFGRSTQTHDPIIHFYETFLTEYDPKLRKSRGVWYTPEPVVNFIVRAVDDILKTEFNLPQGLADTSKTKIKVNTQTIDKKTGTYKQVEQEVHKVQILDPATGTGTFLAEVVKHIHKQFEGQEGIWSTYVDEHLIPRLNGFELLMASYAMAHLKLDMLLRETGYTANKDQRFKIFLTNSLEESHPDTGTLFANWLSSEANEANHIKRDTPVMVVVGNPPYSVSSNNKSKWIQNLIADYKKDLNERKINLDDDYIKFIRYGQHYIDKNGSGILAYISNNSFIDGITHRQMRKNLLYSFDKIYILDLHGNSKKQETSPDGSVDQNVFDIMQGVSINIFVKSGTKKENELGKVFYFELQGKREYKYECLNENSIRTLCWKQLEYTQPNMFFIPKNFDEIKIYEKGFILSDFFKVFSIGVESQNDAITISDNLNSLKSVLADFNDLSEGELINKYQLKDGRDWKVKTAKLDVLKGINIQKIQYRPFDIRYTNYSGNSKGFQAYPRKDVIGNLLNDNLALTSVKLNRKFEQTTFFITNKITDKSISSTLDNSTVFPLYLYPETTAQQSLDSKTARVPNLNMEIVNQIAEKLNLAFVPDDNIVCDLPAGFDGTLYPLDILDYIYAVLHSPAYREKYKEFLKIDFPRVPYPKDKDSFDALVDLGAELRQIHLLEHAVVNKPITKYPKGGSNVVEKPRFEMYNYDCVIPNEKGEIEYPDYLGAVYINDEQYFADVPSSAWNFYIGGYQPAQKWLKDRKGRVLSIEDIMHYQKIIVALTETGRLMREIDLVGLE